MFACLFLIGGILLALFFLVKKKWVSAYNLLLPKLNAKGCFFASAFELVCWPLVGFSTSCYQIKTQKTVAAMETEDAKFAFLCLFM
jgi:hypothetical protein